MAGTKDSISEAIIELDRVVQACGLTISITKFLVAGKGVTQTNLDPIKFQIGGSTIKSVSSFQYLGSAIDYNFSGALQRSVFSDRLLSLQTKKIVYQAVVLSVSLHTLETWPIKQRNLHCLEVFHHREYFRITADCPAH